jgi:hypothetical protein
MDERRRDLILHKRVQRIADEHGCSVAEVNTVLDHHPIETNRDEFLRRALALELFISTRSWKPSAARRSSIATYPSNGFDQQRIAAGRPPSAPRPCGRRAERRGVRTASGKPWHAMQIIRMRGRLDL